MNISFARLLLFLASLALMCGAGIAEVVVAYKSIDESDCLRDYDLAGLRYSQWLKIDGIVWMSFFVVFVAPGLYRRIMDVTHAHPGPTWWTLCLVSLTLMFLECWTIVGAVLYFKEVEPECSDTSTPYVFGMFNFCFSVFVRFCCVCPVVIVMSKRKF